MSLRSRLTAAEPVVAADAYGAAELGVRRLARSLDICINYEEAKMKKLLIACILGVSCLGAKAADEPAEFRQAFARYQDKGTLFYYQTPREFEAKGWGKLYRDAVSEQFRGTPVDELRLEVSPVESYKAQVGEMVALKFRLNNNSDKDVPVTVSGSCKTVHQAGYMVIDPQGRLIQSIGRGKVGGPHCFCKQNCRDVES